MDGSPKAFHAFLTNLSKNTAARTVYNSDPVGVMNAAGLTETQITAVQSKDPAAIQKELGLDDDAAFPRVRVTIIVTVEF
jgi:hypothetical protein